jgi:transmembrane sensor
VLSLGDGSVVTPLGKGSRLLARQVSETDVVVALVGSGARFDVPERKARRFRAELGALALETHGAAFHVHVDRHRVEVAAERGELRARIGPDPRDAQVVVAGETRAFPIAAPGSATEAVPDHAADAAPVDRGEPVVTPPLPSWREYAGRGDYPAAWAALGALRTPLDGMEDLLLAGDVARLSGHARAAVAPLTRAVALHPDDPRAPLAAFTLGRVHLEDLGAPRDAALAFARARMLGVDGPLAEDALAREVEAWSRAGEIETARARAVLYIERYPQGRRVHAVRRFGGLERP